MRIFPLLSLLLVSSLLSAQKLDSSSFNFWLGEWHLTWEDQKETEHHGHNRIEKILDGKVIQENFADSSRAFFGKSWSTWNPKTQTWRQVWTDNQSSFLEFTGESYGDTLAFVMEPALVNGQNLARRMIFYNIRQDSFTWDWQAAPSGTDLWKLQWRIRYERQKKAPGTPK